MAANRDGLQESSWRNRRKASINAPEVTELVVGDTTFRTIRLPDLVGDPTTGLGDNFKPTGRTKYIGPDEQARWLHRIRRLRIEQGLSVEQVAEESGCDAALVAEIEDGTEQRPADHVLRRLAKVLIANGDVDALAPWNITDAEAVEAEAALPKPSRATVDPHATPPPFDGNKQTREAPPNVDLAPIKAEVKEERDVRRAKQAADTFRGDLELADVKAGLRSAVAKLAAIRAGR